MTTIYCGSPEMEENLLHELQKYSGRSQIVGPGIVSSTGDRLIDAVFARQVLPNTYEVRGQGTDELAAEIFRAWDEESELDVLSGKAKLSVFVPSPGRAPKGSAPKSPLEEDLRRLQDTLEQKRAGRARKKEVSAVADAELGSRQIQILLLTSEKAYVTEVSTERRVSLDAWPVFLSGPTPNIGNAPAPSSAFRKLAEALRWLDLSDLSGMQAMDLGGAPGGWTFVLLEAGAKVIAYDRAKMDPNIESHPSFTHARADAFADVDFTGQDMVVCDIIAKPDMIMGLLGKALKANPRFLVFTVKLQMPLSWDDLGLAQRELKSLSSERGYQSRMKHLFHNKHEVTVLLKKL